LHRPGGLARLRPRPCLDRAHQPDPPDPAFRQRHRRPAPAGGRRDQRRRGMSDGWAIGLMTGTVLDGNIDVAAIRTDGESVTAFGAHRLAPYPDGLKDLLFRTLAEARDWNFTGPEPAIFAEAEDRPTRAQAAAVAALIEDEGLRDAGIVGFHGQTVLHRGSAPGRPGATRQLGDGALMARILGLPVAWDFRSADVAAGGQGAPLSAVYH